MRMPDWVRLRPTLIETSRIKEIDALPRPRWTDHDRSPYGRPEGGRVRDIPSILWRGLKTFNLISHVVERDPPDEFGKPVQFIPIRFIYTNKINKDDKLLLGFDALVLSGSSDARWASARIIHGDDRFHTQSENLGLGEGCSATNWEDHHSYYPIVRHQTSF